MRTSSAWPAAAVLLAALVACGGNGASQTPSPQALAPQALAAGMTIESLVRVEWQDGSTMAAWALVQRGADGVSTQVQSQRFDRNGQPLGAPRTEATGGELAVRLAAVEPEGHLLTLEQPAAADPAGFLVRVQGPAAEGQADRAQVVVRAGPEPGQRLVERLASGGQPSGEVLLVPADAAPVLAGTLMDRDGVAIVWATEADGTPQVQVQRVIARSDAPSLPEDR